MLKKALSKHQLQELKKSSRQTSGKQKINLQSFRKKESFKKLNKGLQSLLIEINALMNEVQATAK